MFRAAQRASAEPRFQDYASPVVERQHVALVRRRGCTPCRRRRQFYMRHDFRRAPGLQMMLSPPRFAADAFVPHAASRRFSDGLGRAICQVKHSPYLCAQRTLFRASRALPSPLPRKITITPRAKSPTRLYTGTYTARRDAVSRCFIGQCLDAQQRRDFGRRHIQH